jgi:hypothetical protein
MIQSFLFMLAPTQTFSDDSEKLLRPFIQMATRNHSGDKRSFRKQSKAALLVAANSVGFILFLAGLGLALRLMEALL